MASGMKWLVTTVALCALVGALALRFDAGRGLAVTVNEPVLDENGNTVWDHPLALRRFALSDELTATRIAYHEQAAWDSGYAELPDTAALRVAMDREPVRWPGMRTDTASLARRGAFLDSVRAAFDDEVAARLAEPVRARIALVQTSIDADSGTPYYMYVDASPMRFFAGSDERGGFCFATFPNPAVAIEQGQPLGPCRLWARYGAPSPQVLAWLARSGHLLEFDSVRTPVSGYRSRHPGLLSGQEDTPRRVLFGMRAYDEPTDHVRFPVQACIGGRTDGCLEAVLDADNFRFRRARIESLALEYRGRYAALEVIGGFFGDIEREIGRDRFARFWTSAAEPEAELAAALGAPLDEWVRDWLARRFGREPLGPRVEWFSLLLSLAAIGALLLLALLTARRRTVA